MVNPFVGLRPYEEQRGVPLLRTRRTERRAHRHGSPASASSRSSGSRAAASRRSCGPGCSRRLHGGFMAAAGSSWRIALLRPGKRAARQASPRRCTMRCAIPCAPNRMCFPSAVIEATLRRSSLGLIEAVRQARIAPRRQRARRRRPVRGAVPLQAREGDAQSRGRRGGGSSSCCSKRRSQHDGADLRHADDALGFPRRLRAVPRAARSDERQPVPDPADESRRAATGDRRSDRRRRRARSARGSCSGCSTTSARIPTSCRSCSTR